MRERGKGMTQGHEGGRRQGGMREGGKETRGGR